MVKERAICAQCYSSFTRDEDQASWRVLCVKCWLESKGKRTAKADASEALNDLKAEIGSNIRGLIQLSHPDRHGGSDLATRTTAWLNSLRERLGL